MAYVAPPRLTATDVGNTRESLEVPLSTRSPSPSRLMVPMVIAVGYAEPSRCDR
jgi:hypothetical protein